jgi:hypothetical protein
MSTDLPEYYRHLLASSPDDEPAEAPSSAAPGVTDARAPAGPASDETPGPRPYRADAFTLPLPDPDWRDATTYTLLGPVSGGIRHNVTVHLDDAPEADALADYVAAQMGPLEASLPDGRVLMHGPLTLDCGLDAYRAILRWQPDDRDTPLYQEQIYVLHDGLGYTLTATFTRATRKRFGPGVERLMRTFRPRPGARGN